uniref:Ig-like domain-containing protein n=1 Tax=Caenorhabditis tropicalis TaxID=1561998 RepID=A0A1I7U9A8_9PELO
MNRLNCFIILLAVSIWIIGGNGDATSDTEIIKKLLGKGYDWRVRPPGINLTIPGTHGAVIVTVNMLIRSISKIDDVNMEYSVQLTFREEWVDGRLAYGLPGDDTPDFLILTAGQKIWMPDSFFQNEKQAHKHDIDKPNVLIRIHRDGRILYSVRISMVLSCPMHLQYYPMDVQTCLIDLASYAYTESDIEYRWKKQEPVQLKKGLHSSLPSFQLNNVDTTLCTSKTNTGTYSCLRTILELRRQFSYYLLQLYIPSTMLVIVSWVSFWLDRGAVPARVTLGVTTLLTMTTQASGINAKLPPVSYTKAIDVWIGACLTFIFGALLEFAWVTYISSRRKKICSSRNSLLAETRQALIIPNTVVAQFPAEEGAETTETRVDMSITESPDVWIRRHGNGKIVTEVNGHLGNKNDESAELIIIDSKHKNRRYIWWTNFKNLRLIRWVRRRLDVEDNAKRADLISSEFLN